MNTEWYCRIAGVQSGPFTLAVLAEMAQTGRLGPMDFVRKSAEGTWMPASAVSGLEFRAAAEPTAVSSLKPPPPPPHGPSYYPSHNVTTTNKPVWPWVVGALVGCCLLAGIIFLIAVSAAMKGTNDNAEIMASSSVSETAPLAAHARLHVVWEDGTPELLAMASELTQEQAVALGLFTLATKSDFYAARVRITNTGDLPVRVYPQNILIRLGNDSTGVITANDPRFLQPMVLEPRTYTDGLVMYKAHVTAGAAVRLGSGGLSYVDDTIEVTY